MLLQAAIGQHYIEDFTLRQEMSYMIDIATRILKVREYIKRKKTKNLILKHSLNFL